MASTKIDIKDEVSPEIKRKIGLLGNPASFFGRTAILMHRSILKNFQEGGRPTRWQPSRRAIRERGQTLVDTGLLRASIGWMVGKSSATIGVQGQSEALAGTRFGSVKSGAPKIGTQIGYGLKHQKGLGVPRRKFILIQEEDKRKIMTLLDRHLA